LGNRTMRAKILTTLLFGFGLSTLSHAAVIGVKADLSYWDFDGYSQDNNFKHELDRQRTAQLSVAVEHPVPLVPDAKIKYGNLDSTSEQRSPVNAPGIELNS